MRLHSLDPSSQRPLVLGLALGVALGGCGFHSDLAALGRLRARIHDQIGCDASVNVHSSEGATTVTIRLASQPLGDPKQIQEQVEAIAKAEFPSTNYVVILGRP